MSIAQSVLHLAKPGEGNDNGIDDYKPPKARKKKKAAVKATPVKSKGRSRMGMQVAQSVSDEEAKSMRPQRNAKGQYLSGHDGQFKPGNQAALKWTEEKAMEIAQALLEWMNEDQRNFLMKDFLFEQGLYADLIATLSERYPSFAEYIVRAKEIEAHRIQKFALTNNLNANMAQWVLGVHHKQHNVQKQEITGRDGAPLSTPTITIQPVKVQTVVDVEENSIAEKSESNPPC
jgi:hypothetical protein